MDIAPLRATVGSPGLAAIAPNFKATASNVFQHMAEYGPEKAFDGDFESRWATDSGVHQAWLEVDFGKPVTFSSVLIDEWAPRIRSFDLQYYADSEWKTFYHGTTVGEQWKKSFGPVTARRVRLNIFDATDGPTINEFEIHAK